MITILSVIGTRPEAIKMAPVILEARKYKGLIRSIVCVTAQHRQMLDQVLDVFDIHPDYDLNVMQEEQQLHELTSILLQKLAPIVAEVKPDWILAQGDTTTVLITALSAYYQQVPFAHVEAGLRTHDLFSPFPEEGNRRIADSLARLLFAPTQRAVENLLCEGIPKDRIVLTGNTVVDALMTILEYPYDWTRGPLRDIPLGKKIILITLHRRESFGDHLYEICWAVRDVAATLVKDGFHIVFPTHLNPSVRKPVTEILGGVIGISLLDPLDYISMVHLMKRSSLILTDSGGIQEEAPSLGVPVLVTRDVTERPEGIEVGVARLIGRKRDRIVKEILCAIQNLEDSVMMNVNTNPYGDGKAAHRIINALLECTYG